jgi:hypothetical protein
VPEAVLEEEIADGEVLQVAIKGVHIAAYLRAAHGPVHAEVELMVHGAINQKDCVAADDQYAKPLQSPLS